LLFYKVVICLFVFADWRFGQVISQLYQNKKVVSCCWLMLHTECSEQTQY